MVRRMLKSQQQGFTLIELVTVIVVLGIVSVGISGFLRSGFQIYSDANERQQLLSESHFLVERLNRELRMAIPNSVRTIYDATTQVQCLEFVPALWASFYTRLPVLPSVATQARIVELPADNTYGFQAGDYAFVYPTSTEDVYDASQLKRRTVLACSDEFNSEGNSDGDGDCNNPNSASHTAELTLSGPFADDSPASRMYFGRNTVSFCASNQTIYRREDNINTLQSVYFSGDIMAQHLTNDMSDLNQLPFTVSGAVLTRNSLVQVLLAFEHNEERMDYNIEVHIPNVP